MASGQEELTPLCSSHLACCALSLVSAQRDWDFGYRSLFQNRAWSEARKGYGNPYVGGQQARMGSDLGPAGTEEGQANELGWESSAHSCVVTYFPGCQIGGGGTCASYTEKGCPKSCSWHSPSQRCFPVLNGVSKFLLLWIRDFWCPRDSQGLLAEELWDDICPAWGYDA